MPLIQNRKMDVFFLLVILLTAQMGFFVIPPAAVRGQGKNIITGLFSPTIDGFHDKGNPFGYLGEWGDALIVNAEFVTTENETIPVELLIKYVAGTLYVGFEYPGLLEVVCIQVDLNHDNKLSDGDLQIIINKGKLCVRMYRVSPPAICTRIEDLLSIEDLQTLQKVMNIGSIAMEAAKGKTVVEIAFSDRKLIDLLEEHGIPANLYELYALLGMGKINFGLLAKTQQGVFSASAPCIPYQAKDIDNDFECIWMAEYLPYEFEFDVTVPPAFQADVGIDHIEVIQAIQTEDNAMPLVLDKTSLARVFIDNPSGSPKDVTVKLTGMTLNGIIFAYELLDGRAPFEYTIIPEMLLYQNLGTLQQDFTAPANPPDREELSHSANFDLPASWLDNHVLLLKAEVEMNGLWTDPDSTNDVYSESFAFFETHDMNIYFIRINANTAEAPVLVSDAFVNENTGNLSVIYPMANPTFIELDWSTIGVFTGGSDEVKAELTDVACEMVLVWLLVVMFGGDPSFALPDQVFGFRTTGAGSSTPSWYNDGACYAAWAGLNSAHHEITMSHEIDHNIGPNSWGRHVSGPGYGCNAPGPDATWQGLYTDGEIHEPGWYPGATELIPPDHPDLMTYCCLGTYPRQWISDYRWERIFDRLRDWTPGVPDPTLEPYLSPEFLKKLQPNTNKFDPTNGDYSIRVIQGVLHLDSSGELKPSFAYPTPEGSSSAFIGTWPTPEEPVAHLRVFYQNGSQLTLPIDAQFISHEGENETTSSFTRIVPDNGEVTLIQLLDDSYQVLDQLNATGFTVNDASIVGPAEIQRNTLTEIQWDLDLTNSTNIYAQLQYSHNDLSWYPLGQPTLGSSTEILFDSLPGSDNASMRLLLTDGVQTEIVEGYNFVLANLPPSVEISSNAPSQVIAGARVSLSATGRDPETGPIANESLAWKITKDSSTILETTGGTLITQLTETGTYQIAVTATDPDGQKATETIELEVIGPSYLSEDTWEEFVLELEATRGSFSFPFPFLEYPLLALFSALLIVTIIARSYQRRKRSMNQ